MMRSFLLAGAVLLSPGLLQGQPGWGTGGWGAGGWNSRSGRFHGGGDWNSARSLARELEQRTDAFKRQFDHQIDRTRWDETPLEHYIWEQTKRLENAADGLRDDIDRRRMDGRAERRLQEALQAASEIDRAMRRVRLGPDTERNWRAIRSGLFELARFYRVRD
jgi:hypothetical protein